MRMLPILLLCLLPLAASADTAPTYNRVSFTAQASTEVENDTLVAVLYAQREGPRADVIANQVNRLVDQAVEQAKQVPGVEVQTGAYRTTAVYKDSNIRGWRVYQSIRLESQDSKRLGDLIGRLQNLLNVQSISYQLSPRQERKYQKRLITEALHKFQARAKEIADTLGKSGYRIVHLSVNTGGNRPLLMRAAAMNMARSERVGNAPRIEAGTQRLQVNLSAEVELKD